MPEQTALVEKYLEYVRVEKRLAQRTVELYALDLHKLQSFAAQAGVDLQAVRNPHVRRWVAQMHSGGRSGRGIALILSGWRGFYTWLGRQGLVASNPVQDVRAPKAPKPLPKALGVDDAVQFADFQSEDDPWLEARDAAMVELLYGSGLRVGELIGLDVEASSHARGAGSSGALHPSPLSRRRPCAVDLPLAGKRARARQCAAAGVDSLHRDGHRARTSGARAGGPCHPDQTSPGHGNA